MSPGNTSELLPIVAASGRGSNAEMHRSLWDKLCLGWEWVGRDRTSVTMCVFCIPKQVIRFVPSVTTTQQQCRSVVRKRQVGRYVKTKCSEPYMTDRNNMNKTLFTEFYYLSIITVIDDLEVIWKVITGLQNFLNLTSQEIGHISATVQLQYNYQRIENS